MPLNNAHVEWCRSMFRMLHDGSAWGVPRSGLVYRKRGNALVLVARMPHERDMPITAGELAEAQQRDIDDMVRYFTAAGIEVRDETNPDSPGIVPEA